MNKNNNVKNGFSKLSVLVVLMVVIFTVFVFTSCSGSDDNNKKADIETTSEVKNDISDSSMEFSGNIVKTTCLDCHPGMKDNGFDIDFTKVKEAGMIIDKGQDVIKEEKKESEK